MTDADCPNTNPCTTNMCYMGVCITSFNNGASCNDNNACTTNDVCTNGVCGGTQIDCNDNNVCTTDSCNPATGCVHTPITCNDNNACTTDTCNPASGCVFTPIVCTASDQCHVAGTCDSSTGQCSNPDAADGTTCVGSNLCYQTNMCESGVCTGSDPVVCGASNICGAPDTCDPTSGSCLASPVCTEPFQLRYVANLIAGDSYVNLTNDGSSGGNICVNVYAFDPAEELVSCCSCNLTPNSLQSLSVKTDLLSNTLTPATPTSVTVELVPTPNPAGTVANCNAAAGSTLAPGLQAWATTIHAAPQGTYGTTETPFSSATLSVVELNRMTEFCGFAQSNGSGYGICKSCQAGGLGGAKQ